MYNNRLFLEIVCNYMRTFRGVASSGAYSHDIGLGPQITFFLTWLKVDGLAKTN